MITENNSLTLAEEKNLVEMAKKDKEAFATLYEIYFARIHNYILRRAGDIDLAEDLTSQVFMKVLDNIQKFEWRGLPFSAWLYRIASNVLMTHYRKNKHQSVVDLDDISFMMVDSELTPLEKAKEQDETIENNLKYKSVKKALIKIKPKYAEIIVFKFFEKKGNSEIAEILSISEGNLRIRLFRALKELKKILVNK